MIKHFIKKVLVFKDVDENVMWMSLY